MGLLAVMWKAVAAMPVHEGRRHAPPSMRAPMRQSFARMPGLLRRRALRGLLTTAFAEGFLIFGALAFVALYFQRRFGLGPGAAGTLVGMYAIGGMLYATVAPRALRAFGEIGLAPIGGVALALGYAVLAASP